mmetsp:Transcript_10806/g.25879  ORF Transcript_10806/g.25879 Transcript_10806/m.25879 type:complete len:262 (+) Transcript_10806:313-1098(+)
MVGALPAAPIVVLLEKERRTSPLALPVIVESKGSAPSAGDVHQDDPAVPAVSRLDVEPHQSFPPCVQWNATLADDAPRLVVALTDDHLVHPFQGRDEPLRLVLQLKVRRRRRPYGLHIHQLARYLLPAVLLHPLDLRPILREGLLRIVGGAAIRGIPVHQRPSQKLKLPQAHRPPVRAHHLKLVPGGVQVIHIDLEDRLLPHAQAHGIQELHRLDTLPILLQVGYDGRDPSLNGHTELLDIKIQQGLVKEYVSPLSISVLV